MTKFYGAFKVLKPAFNTASIVTGNSSTTAVTFDPTPYVKGLYGGPLSTTTYSLKRLTSS